MSQKQNDDGRLDRIAEEIAGVLESLLKMISSILKFIFEQWKIVAVILVCAWCYLNQDAAAMIIAIIIVFGFIIYALKQGLKK